MKRHRKNFVAGLTWDEVASRLREGAAALLPVGAGAKQHGLHMPMGTDQFQAEWFASHLSERIDALIWPTLTYGAYPAFIAYAGSISLSDSTFVALVAEIVEGLIGCGSRRVLILDTGISTVTPIDNAIADVSAPARVRHLKLHNGSHYLGAVARLSRQPHGSHADEIETSVMLALAPHLVNMARAQASPPLRDGPKAGPLKPDDPDSPNFSPGGSFGDPTKASRDKGYALIDAILQDLIAAATG